MMVELDTAWFVNHHRIGGLAEIDFFIILKAKYFDKLDFMQMKFSVFQNTFKKTKQQVIDR
jgi:hypothetical protein